MVRVTMKVLYQVKAPHFTAGIEVFDGMIIVAAPILKWTLGIRIDQFIDYCRRKKWVIVNLDAKKFY